MRNNNIESSLKRFLKRKVKITIGLVVLFLITGTIGFAADKAAEGESESYTITEEDGTPKIIGGWNYTENLTENKDHSASTSNITLVSGEIDELIGGNHIKNVKSIGTYLYSIGNTNVIMKDGKVQYLIGGSKSNGTNADIKNGAAAITVTGGIIGKADSNGVTKAGLIGGNYIKSTNNQGKDITAKITGGTHVSITGGTFANRVIGGSFADTYGTAVNGMSVTDDTTDVNIAGGVFNDAVIGGGAAAGTGNTSTVETSNLTITGGIFNSSIYAGGAALEGVKGKNDIGTVNVVNSNLTIDRTGISEGSLKFDFARNYGGVIFAGGLNSGISNTIELTLKNLNREVFKTNLDLHGGSRATAGNSIKDGNIEVNVLNSSLNGDNFGDLYAGGEADGAGAKVTTGNSTLILNEFSAGKRIFGSGRVLDNGIFEQESTDIQLNNVIGKQLYGGGWNRKNITASADNSSQSLKVGATKMVIGGEKTELGQVFGGSIISGTGNKGTVSVGETDITINNGKITGCVAGGNFSNWFGYSVVGIEEENGKYEYVNGKKYNAGSTNITINDGDLSGADIIGGNYTEHLSSNYNEYQRKAIVFGDTNININGGKLGLIIGGGEAGFWSGSGNDPATESNVEGTTNINIIGGSLSGNIIGGGYAFSDHSDVESVADIEGITNINISGGTIKEDIYGGGCADGTARTNVKGTTNINISGGTIEKDIYGGGYADGSSATANVDGDANITISGGDIKGNIYAGGLSENEGTSKVTGKSTVTFLDGSTFANKVQGAANTSTLAFGNANKQFNGEFRGEFSDFSIINTGKNSIVKINELSNSNVNQDMELTGTGRIETSINNIEGNIALSSGTLAADKVNLGGKKLTLSGKGILETKSENIFTNSLDSEGTETKESGEVKNNSIEYNGGSVALNDSKYNLDYLNSAIAAMKNKSQSKDKTTLLMLGTLVNTGGEAQEDITIDTAAGVGDGAILDNVVVKVDEGSSSLVIGGDTEVGDKKVNNGFNASTLDFKDEEDNKSITIAGDSKVILGGSGDGELVTVGGKAAENTNINIKEGTLVLGSELSSTANQILSAEVQVGTDSNSGKLEVNAGNQTVTGKITNNESGTVAVKENAALSAEEVENKGTLSVVGNAAITALTGGENSIITVGNNEAAGKLIVESLKLNGGTMFLDPAWKEGEVNTIGNASHSAVKFDKSSIDGEVKVGQNSVMVIGDTDIEWVEKAFENSGLAWKDDVTAALAIKGNQTLNSSKGSITVDGTLTSNSTAVYTNTDEKGNLNFTDNSLLVVDTGSLNGRASISDVKSLSVADTSKLYLENMIAGTHIIISGDGVSTGSVWTDDNILSSDRMLIVIGNKEANNFKVNAEVQKAENVLPGITTSNMIDNIWQSKLNNINSSNEGIKFLSRAMSDIYITDTGEAVKTINGAVQIAGAAGVHRTGIDTIKRTSDIAARQLSFTNKDNAEEGLWAEMSYGSTDVSGLKVGNTDTGYNGRYEGVSVGSNFKTWEKGALGAAFHYVSGENKSDEGFNRTKNEYEYFGLSLYNNLRIGNINIIGDLGYSKGDNEIKQDTVLGRLKADVDTELMTAGIKGEYLIKKDNFNIVPYAGVRYVRLNTDSFDTKNDTGKLFHTEKEDADLLLVPVGINISTETVNQSGWTLKPKLDLAYVGTLGDKKSNTKIGIYGMRSSDQIKIDVAESSGFLGSAGVEFKKDNKSFEIGYSLYSSKYVTENRGTMSFKYSF